MRDTANEIKERMRAQVTEHNLQVARETARDAVHGLAQLIEQHPLRYAASRDVRREDVEALLLEVDTYATLLAEVVPSLPAREVAPSAEAAE